MDEEHPPVCSSLYACLASGFTRCLGYSKIAKFFPPPFVKEKLMPSLESDCTLLSVVLARKRQGYGGSLVAMGCLFGTYLRV
jgi:hypothetical protein